MYIVIIVHSHATAHIMPKINYYLRYLPTRDSHISRYPIPVNRGSLITHVKFQLPSADATFLDVMAGFDMCSRYLLYC